jgi:hypothetical protein
MRALRRIRRELPQVPPYRVQLPQQPLLHLRRLAPDDEAIDQPRDQVGAESETRGDVALTLVLRPRALEERRVRQDVRGRLGITEELLRREQDSAFQ